MSTINVARVLNNRRFLDSFMVWRKTGAWVKGRFVQNEVPLNYIGIVTSAGTQDIMQVPEGDRGTEVKCFHSIKPLFMTRNNPGDKGTSDEIVWDNKRYRLYQANNWGHMGYYKVIGVEMGGAG